MKHGVKAVTDVLNLKRTLAKEISSKASQKNQERYPVEQWETDRTVRSAYGYEDTEDQLL